VLYEVPKRDEPKHAAVCSIDGEPWPCVHEQRAANRYWRRYHSVRCLACGKPGNAGGALSIEQGFDG